MLNQLLTSDAFAQASDVAAATETSSLASFVPLILIFAVFYFLIVRPQGKKMKEHQNLISNLKVGNKVITNGGMVGVVTEILSKEDQVEVEIAENVRVKFQKNFITDLVEKPENKKLTETKKRK
jgi:preprotein translocase subunit YajC